MIKTGNKDTNYCKVNITVATLKKECITRFHGLCILFFNFATFISHMNHLIVNKIVIVDNILHVTCDLCLSICKITMFRCDFFMFPSKITVPCTLLKDK